MMQSTCKTVKVELQAIYGHGSSLSLLSLLSLSILCVRFIYTKYTKGLKTKVEFLCTCVTDDTSTTHNRPHLCDLP